MGKRPRSITVISWIFVAAGIVGLTYHASEFKVERPFNPDFLWVWFVRLLAILFGGYMLRGNNWARWGLVLWLGYHVILSGLHRPFELIVHSLLFAVVFYFLFRPQASAYFRGAKTKWKLNDDYPITEYRCGARAGERVRLRQDLAIHDHEDRPAGKVYRAGEIWTVLSGSAEPPIVVWLQQTDGKRHTWSDDDDFWNWFERVDEAAR